MNTKNKKGPYLMFFASLEVSNLPTVATLFGTPCISSSGEIKINTRFILGKLCYFYLQYNICTLNKNLHFGCTYCLNKLVFQTNI